MITEGLLSARHSSRDRPWKWEQIRQTCLRVADNPVGQTDNNNIIIHIPQYEEQHEKKTRGGEERSDKNFCIRQENQRRAVQQYI